MCIDIVATEVQSSAVQFMMAVFGSVGNKQCQIQYSGMDGGVFPLARG